MRGVLARENFLFCAIVFFLVQSLIGFFFFGKFPSFLFAIKLIKNDLAFLLLRRLHFKRDFYCSSLQL